MARLTQMHFALICLMIYYRTIEGIMVTFYGYGSGYHGQTVYLHGDCQPVKTFPVRGQAIIGNNRWNVTVEMESCSFIWKWRISEKIWEFIHLGNNGNRVTSIPDTKRKVFIYSTFDATDVSVLELHDVAFILENLPNTTSEYTVCGKCETKLPFNDPNRAPLYWTQQRCSDSGTVKDNKVVINWIVISCHFLWSWSDNTNSRQDKQNHFEFKNNLCSHESIIIRSSWSGPPKSHTCEPMVSPTRPTSPQTTTLSTRATSTAPQSISFGIVIDRSSSFKSTLLTEISTSYSSPVEWTMKSKKIETSLPSKGNLSLTVEIVTTTFPKMNMTSTISITSSTMNISTYPLDTTQVLESAANKKTGIADTTDVIIIISCSVGGLILILSISAVVCIKKRRRKLQGKSLSELDPYVNLTDENHQPSDNFSMMDIASNTNPLYQTAAFSSADNHLEQTPSQLYSRAGDHHVEGLDRHNHIEAGSHQVKMNPLYFDQSVEPDFPIKMSTQKVSTKIVAGNGDQYSEVRRIDFK